MKSLVYDDVDDHADRDIIGDEFGLHVFYRDSSQVGELAMMVCLLDNDGDNDCDDDDEH